ncbi:NmrA family NAD(P)-binding protein [Rhodopila sp.]|uniref:NmrA family NAD(P)-binding protein n=1 Tax=Rhodopila sp. TaxID=2480087 RepID=UPI003D112F3A
MSPTQAASPTRSPACKPCSTSHRSTLPDQAAIGQRVVAQAARAGVARFVFSSVIHPVLSSLPNHAAKAPVEQAIIDSGLEYAILHPAVLYQNFAAAWRDITEKRTLAEPWSNETRHSRVDYRDVAEVAAIALIDDRLTNGTFELCAEGNLDRHAIAAMLADITGHSVEARRIDPTTLVGPKADALRPMYDHYERHGLQGNALTLRAILGREARSLRAYFEHLANARC